MARKVGDYHNIALTGDCIDKGQAELFQDFGAKMDGIKKACHVNKKRVISVPGNHDASRQNGWLSGIKTTYSDTDKVLNGVKVIFLLCFLSTTSSSKCFQV